jgi:hypothetical protein
LEAYARALHQRHNGIPILRDIVNDMAVTMKAVLSQLLLLLRGQIQLSKCLRGDSFLAYVALSQSVSIILIFLIIIVVGYLRRMEVFDEQRLRSEFLRSRNAYLEQTLATIPSTQANPYDVIMTTLPLALNSIL